MPLVTVTPPTTIATEEDLQLDLFVDGPQWEGAFDSLEVWRSRVTDKGPYEELTGPVWSVPRIPKGAADKPSSPVIGPSVILVGKTLNLRVDEKTDITVVFTGVDPLTYADASAQIITQGEGLITSYIVGSVLVIEGVKPGNGAILRVVGGDAAPSLGLPTTEPQSVAFGQDARLPLVHGKQLYAFVDHNGDPSFFYRTRFFNSLLNTMSDFSQAFSGKFVSVISPTNLVRATVDLVDGKGMPFANKAVLLHAVNKGIIVEGKTVVDDDVEKLTDENGHVEFNLVRGQKFTIAIGGTDIVRDFTTPTDTAVLTFDMLDPANSTDDAFSVQKPDLNFAVRRSV